MNIIGLSYSDRLELAIHNRHQAIQAIFQQDISPLSSLMGPMSDGPEWPAGAAWLATQHQNNACIISDGLSDPWVERDLPQIGLGLEVFIESPDIKIPKNQDLSYLADYWMFPMIAEVSHTLASFPKLSTKLCAGELLSIEFNIDHIKDGRGRVGALLHAPKDMVNRWPTDNGEIHLIAATLLTPSEMRYLRGKGASGRNSLLTALYNAGVAHHSLVKRDSVI